jgi:lipoprotein-releasing system permease protein
MFQWKLAIRYFLHRPTSWLAVGAVALCVFIVVVVLTVMNGLSSDFKQRNHAFVGDCLITTDSLVGFPRDPEFIKHLQSQPFIEAVSESILGVGLITQPGADWNIGVQFMGIDPVLHSAVTGFADTLYYKKGSPEKAFIPDYAPDQQGCVAGIDLIGGQRTLGGDYEHPEKPMAIRLILSSFPLTAKGALARAGTDLVSSKTYYVADDSHTGLPQVDGSMLYLPMQDARLLTGMDSPVARISTVHIKFKPFVSTAQGTDRVRALWNQYIRSRGDSAYDNLFASVRVQTWLENRRSRIAAIEKEQNLLILLFLMLGIITVFIVFVIFYMLVGHKSRDIGILQSVGMARSKIAAVFLNFAALIGILGALLGTAAGCVFLIYINPIEDWLFEHFNFQVWDRTVYAIGEIPNQIQVGLLSAVAFSAVAACLLGAFVPALQASRKEAVQVLQVSQV